MKKKFNSIFLRLFLCGMVISLTACSSTIPGTPSMLILSTQAETTIPTSRMVAPTTIVLSPTPYNSAPQDETLDLNCRITINSFFSFRKGFNVQDYRSLFVNQSLADAYALHPPTEPRTILLLMPASQWWAKNFPGTPIPAIFMPEEPDEYTYHVEYTGYYESNETPTVAYPDFMTIFMVVNEGPSNACKIKNYGKG
jgi:hypothetical protein